MSNAPAGKWPKANGRVAGPDNTAPVVRPGCRFSPNAHAGIRPLADGERAPGHQGAWTRFVEGTGPAHEIRKGREGPELPAQLGEEQGWPLWPPRPNKKGPPLTRRCPRRTTAPADPVAGAQTTPN